MERHFRRSSDAEGGWFSNSLHGSGRHPGTLHPDRGEGVHPPTFLQQRPDNGTDGKCDYGHEDQENGTGGWIET